MFTWKGFEQCVGEETAHLSILYLKVYRLIIITFLKRLQKLKQETAEIETGIAEKSCWDQANRRQKLGLVWKNRKKISKFIKRLLLLTVRPLNYFMGESIWSDSGHEGRFAPIWILPLGKLLQNTVHQWTPRLSNLYLTCCYAIHTLLFLISPYFQMWNNLKWRMILHLICERAPGAQFKMAATAVRFVSVRYDQTSTLCPSSLFTADLHQLLVRYPSARPVKLILQKECLGRLLYNLNLFLLCTDCTVYGTIHSPEFCF
jgi:hypothetical protein